MDPSRRPSCHPKETAFLERGKKTGLRSVGFSKFRFFEGCSVLFHSGVIDVA